MIGIYKISNKNNGKFYIGRSKDIFGRLDVHLSLLKNGTHPTKDFQNDFALTGVVSDWHWEVLEICKVSEIKIKEEFYIKKYNATIKGYNILENDEQLLVRPERLNSGLTSYVRAAVKKIDERANPSFKVIEKEVMESLIKLFNNNLESCRAKDDIFIIPDEFKELRNPPFVFIYSDFNI